MAAAPFIVSRCFSNIPLKWPPSLVASETGIDELQRVLTHQTACLGSLAVGEGQSLHSLAVGRGYVTQAFHYINDLLLRHAEAQHCLHGFRGGIEGDGGGEGEVLDLLEEFGTLYLASQRLVGDEGALQFFSHLEQRFAEADEARGGEEGGVEGHEAGGGLFQSCAEAAQRASVVAYVAAKLTVGGFELVYLVAQLAGLGGGGLHLAATFLGLEVVVAHLGHQQFVPCPHLVEAPFGGIGGLTLQLGHSVSLFQLGFQSCFLNV